MRTFVAIPLPDECLAILQQLQEKLRSFHADVRWVALPSLHLTLKFLGEVDPSIITELEESLNRASRSISPFSLKLQGIGCFPNLKNPRVIWCGVGGDVDKLSSLQQAVETACTALGFEREERAFQPHLTLGRVNGKRNLQPLLDYIKIGFEAQTCFTAHYYHVYKSTLKPQGAEYTVLSTIKLSADL